MNKKTLQIQTDFLDDEDPHSPIVTTSKINYQEKLEAATLLQKFLSIILAKNFIECWSQLKNCKSQHRIRINSRVYNNRKDGSNYSRQQRVNYFQANGSNIRSHSQLNKFMKSSGTSQVYDNNRNPKRNKSVRVINQEIENSRAGVLKEIVQKLRNIRNVNIMEVDRTQNDQVIKKINHLERVMRSMRFQNHKKVHKISKSNSSQNNQQSEYQQQAEYNNNQNSQQQNDEEDELVKSFMKQIEMIKQQIHDIKISNQAILKSQLERSQVSSSSDKNRTYNTRNEITVQLKQTVTEGVQTFFQVSEGVQTIPSPKNVAVQAIPTKSPIIDMSIFNKFQSIKNEPLRQQPYSKTIPVENNSQIVSSKTKNMFQTQYNSVFQNKVQESKPIFEKSSLPNLAPTFSLPSLYNYSNNFKETSIVPIEPAKLKNQQISKTQVQDPIFHKKQSQPQPQFQYQFQNQTQTQNKPQQLHSQQFVPPQNQSQSIFQYQQQIPQYQPQYQFQPQIQPQPQSQSQLQPKPQSHYQPQPQLQYPSQPQFQIQPQLQPQPQPQPQVQYQQQNLTQHQRQPIAPKPGVTFSRMAVPPSPTIYPGPMPIRPVSSNGYEYPPRSDQVKTKTTFYSKNNVYSDIESSSSLGQINWQVGHLRNPSIQIQQAPSQPITFSNYCGTCGRSCGCPRNFNEVRRA